MSEDEIKKEDKRNDLESDKEFFIARSIYPDAEGIFSGLPEPIEGIIDDCLIVLDTGALLVPFTIGKESLEAIISTYQNLVDLGRLFIPGHVAREFAKQRAAKLKDLYKQISLKSNLSI